MKISELIKVLEDTLSTRGDLEVRASWESITPEIDSIYIGNEKSGSPGVILLDSDDSFYRDQYAETILWKDES
jgi:hypothetical protein